MSENKNPQDSLLELYKLDEDNDQDAKSWSQLLDFNSPIEVESDWFSTKTFQMFLDALDINEPATLAKSKSKNATGESLDKKHENLHDSKAQTSNLNDKIRTNPKLSETSCISTSQTRSSKQLETILSAEALKVLSELPDLTHMSSSRSFIFPYEKKATKR